MTSYAAIIYTADVDWSAPEQQAEMAEYGAFSQSAAAVLRGGAALYPTSSATTVTRSLNGSSMACRRPSETYRSALP